MDLLSRVIAFFIIAFSALATFFGAGVDSDDYDLVVKLESTPSSGYEWVVDISDKNVVSLETHAFTAGFDSLFDGVGLDCYGFSVKNNGAVKITFSYLKNGNYDTVQNQVIYTCVVVAGKLTVLDVYESSADSQIA